MKTWQFKRLTESAVRPRLYVSEGRNKGKFGVVEYAEGNGKLRLILDCGLTVCLHYTAFEELDEFGEPKVLPVMDMTGREINLDSFVCYSASTSTTHALEIGRVFELTTIGGLKVRTIVRNGEKIKNNDYRRGQVNVDPLRCIKLPVDDKTMLVWMMQEFTELVKSK